MTIQSRPSTNAYRENFDRVFRLGRHEVVVGSASLPAPGAGCPECEEGSPHVHTPLGGTMPGEDAVIELVRAARTLVGALPCDRPWTREENGLINALVPFPRGLP